MTDRAQPHHGAPPRPLTQRFPHPGRRVEQAYRELDIALYGSDEEKKALGSPRALARPWDPATCIDPDLRDEVWSWLDDVVTWLNHEYVWDVAAMIPACWPKHPHLVHEIAVLADLRRRAGHALTGDALEEWHRYALPAFTERMRQRMKAHCEDKDHQPWPAQGRCERSTARSVADILLGAYLGTLAGLAIVYPPSRAGLRWTLLVWELACVALVWWGLWRARGRTWGAVEVCLVVLVACESAVVIVGPFSSDPFTRWWIARAFYLGAWGLVSAVLSRRQPHQAPRF